MWRADEHPSRKIRLAAQTAKKSVLNVAQCREMCKAQKRHETNVPVWPKFSHPPPSPVTSKREGASKICLVVADVAGG